MWSQADYLGWLSSWQIKTCWALPTWRLVSETGWLWLACSGKGRCWTCRMTHRVAKIRVIRFHKCKLVQIINSVINPLKCADTSQSLLALICWCNTLDAAPLYPWKWPFHRYNSLANTSNLSFSEERTSSTHALTMFRYNYTIKGTTYKVGKFKFSFFPYISILRRYLGHCWLRIIQWVAPNVLLWRTRLHNGVRRYTQGNLPELEDVVWRNEESMPTHSLHLYCKQNWYVGTGSEPPV